MAEKEILKVKLTDDKTRIEWREQTENGWDEKSLVSCDAPLQSFSDALQDLREDVIKIGEFQSENLDVFEVRGVSFTYHAETGIMGACITALKTLVSSNAPMCINTPHKTCEPYTDGGDDAVCFDKFTVEHLERVQDEARAYLNGQRATQMELFPDATGDAVNDAIGEVIDAIETSDVESLETADIF
jgi:hypothetical protein